MIGGILRLLLKLRADAQERQRAEEYSAQQLALLSGTAVRLGAGLGELDGRKIMSRDGMDIEITFDQAEGRIDAMIWRATVPPPGWPNFDMRRTDWDAADPEVLDQLWPAARLQHLMKGLPGLQVVCRENRITMSRRPAVLYASVIDAVFELMYELLATDPYATRHLRTLGTYHEDELPYVVLDGTDASIGFARVDQRLVTQARSRDGKVIQTWSQVVRDPKELSEIATKLRSDLLLREGVFR